MNDKCAAGTGRFLEVMAEALEVKLEEMGELSLRSREHVEVSSICTVFAESEVVSLLANGQDKADIAAALYEAIARRIAGMAGQVGLREKVVMTGGVAKSIGIMRALERKLGTTLLIPEEPQIVGAHGAAIVAAEQVASATVAL
jgi:predicted CoA-substrate-specific enzyme activase